MAVVRGVPPAVQSAFLTAASVRQEVNGLRRCKREEIRMMTGDHHGMLDVALAQLDAVAERLKLDPGIHKRLRQPQRSLIVSVPTLMEDGRLGVFTGYR